MSTHLAKHRAAMERQAYPVVEQFVQLHPEYSIDANQSGSQSVTNYVIFGHRGHEPIIFKYFCEDERKAREIYGLRHFAQTGLVPELLADDGKRLIVQSHIPGGWISSPGDPDFDAVETQRAGHTLGQATATLLNVPLTPQAARDFESRFYDGLLLERYFRDILDASWQIHQKVDVYRDPLFARSLESIEANLPYILRQKRLLYHQDAMNMHFYKGAFMGFFDLEMCRVGTEAMQIGSLWNFFALHGEWSAFAQGFAVASGRQLDEHDLAAGRAFAHFLVWRYASHSGRWQGEAQETGTATEKEEKAAAYLRSIELNNRVGW
ncbi:MAG: phosphotransferase [Caldilineaceae bacterium]|nr:phosphotransferase [Caldilineaceae bacterium]